MCAQLANIPLWWATTKHPLTLSITKKTQLLHFVSSDTYVFISSSTAVNEAGIQSDETDSLLADSGKYDKGK